MFVEAGLRSGFGVLGYAFLQILEETQTSLRAMLTRWPWCSTCFFDAVWILRMLIKFSLIVSKTFCGFWNRNWLLVGYKSLYKIPMVTLKLWTHFLTCTYVSKSCSRGNLRRYWHQIQSIQWPLVSLRRAWQLQWKTQQRYNVWNYQAPKTCV